MNTNPIMKELLIKCQLPPNTECMVVCTWSMCLINVSESQAGGRKTVQIYIHSNASQKNILRECRHTEGIPTVNFEWVGLFSPGHSSVPSQNYYIKILSRTVTPESRCAPYSELWRKQGEKNKQIILSDRRMATVCGEINKGKSNPRLARVTFLQFFF